MADFENRSEVAARIALEIERKLIALGIDWHDEIKLRELAREALTYSSAKEKHSDPQRIARIECYGLFGLMLKTMEESALSGYETHGSDVWKAVARALWLEKDLLTKSGSAQ